MTHRRYRHQQRHHRRVGFLLLAHQPFTFGSLRVSLLGQAAPYLSSAFPQRQITGTNCCPTRRALIADSGPGLCRKQLTSSCPVDAHCRPVIPMTRTGAPDPISHGAQLVRIALSPTALTNHQWVRCLGAAKVSGGTSAMLFAGPRTTESDFSGFVPATVPKGHVLVVRRCAAGREGGCIAVSLCVYPEKSRSKRPCRLRALPPYAYSEPGRSPRG